MGWFKRQYLWIILSAAAVCVSYQELTSTLRNESHACRGEEVTFTCTIRGSTDVPDLILAWSSTEYIGQGDPLRFTTDSVPGETRPSMINGNVTATLTSNTIINGIPVLVSELHIVADQASTVTCRSVTTTTTNSTGFNISGVPGVPRNFGATDISQLSENGCEIIVKWDPPANDFDIDHYIVYVPSLNVTVNETSFVSTLRLRDCPESFGILIAAVNRFGCIGSYSSEERILIPPSTSPAAPESTSPPTAHESSQLTAGAVVGIAIGVGFIPTVCLVIILFILFRICYIHPMLSPRIAQHQDQVDEQQGLLGKNEENFQEDFQENLMDLYTAIKKDLSDDTKLSSVENLSQMMENRTLIKRYIKEAVKIALKRIKWEKGGDVKKVLIYLKINVPRVLSSFDNELQDKDTDITMANLIDAAKQNVHAGVFDELIKRMDNTEPEIEGLLRIMFEELQTHLQSVEMMQPNPNLNPNPNPNPDDDGEEPLDQRRDTELTDVPRGPNDDSAGKVYVDEPV